MKHRHITKMRRLEAREANEDAMSEFDGMTLRRLARQGHVAAQAWLERLHQEAIEASTPYTAKSL